MTGCDPIDVAVVPPASRAGTGVTADVVTGRVRRFVTVSRGNLGVDGGSVSRDVGAVPPRCGVGVHASPRHVRG